MSRNNLSRANSLFAGRASLGNRGRIGVDVQLLTHQKFGAIPLASANAISLSQSINTGTPGLVNGALASAGVATMVTPRNVVAAWTGTAVLTVTGKDTYGQTMVESSASGTSFTGKKAFATVTSVTVSANVTACTVGTGVAIGCGFRHNITDFGWARVDNAIDAATVVPADATTPATATTGDVRGTITFASAPDGTKQYAVAYIVTDRESKEGSFGVAQFTG